MVDTLVATTVHLVFAAVWVGAVVYFAMSVLPLARDGAFSSTDSLASLTGTVTTVSRVSAVILFLTGGHMAGRGYTVDGLVSTVPGQLVLVMLALWFVLIALVEVGAKRVRTGLAASKLREPAMNALPLFRAAAVIAVALMVVAGMLSGNVAQFL